MTHFTTLHDIYKYKFLEYESSTRHSNLYFEKCIFYDGMQVLSVAQGKLYEERL